MKRYLDHLPPLSSLGPCIALLVACLFFSTQSDRFLSGQNFSLILQQVMVVGVIAIGQTLIILTAGIDLSCGMAMALGSVVMTKFATEHGVHPYLAVICGLMACTLVGYLNGALVTKVKLPAFIVTLGTMNIVFAITQVYSGAQTVTNLPDALLFFGNTFHIGQTNITYGTVLMLGLYLLTWFYLRDTAPGRHIYAVGNNREAARLTGIATDRVLLNVYMLAGLLYGIAALLSVARMGVGDPQAGQTDNLDSITAVVLGGTSLFGGRGKISNALLGALVVAGVENGMGLLGLSAGIKFIVTGLVLLSAVLIDAISRRSQRQSGLA